MPFLSANFSFSSASWFLAVWRIGPVPDGGPKNTDEPRGYIILSSHISNHHIQHRWTRIRNHYLKC